MIKTAKDRNLQALLDALGKHTGYQQLPRVLEPILSSQETKVLSRHESARMAFIERYIDFTDKRVLDIGANSGYFSFEALARDCAHVTIYEGWQPHAHFVEKAAEVVGLADRIYVHAQYYDFQVQEGAWDVCFLLNVLHHLGDDFGSHSLTKEKALQGILTALNGMSRRAKVLVLQLGFCWKGNTGLGLFERGTKSELLAFVKEGVSSDWEIEQVGIAARHDNNVVYEKCDKSNLRRDDTLGEFLNRPLIILKSRHL